MMKKVLFTLIISLVTISSIWSQTSTISGTVYDAETSDVLPFANVSVKNTDKGTSTDFEGKYRLEVEPGNYTVEFSFVGYQTQEITDVTVEPNEEEIIKVTLSAASESLEEVIITTTARRNTEASVLNLQKKSVNLFDGLSIESAKKVVPLMWPLPLNQFPAFRFRKENLYM